MLKMVTHLKLSELNKKTANKQVKFAPVGRWDAQTARAPYLRR
jgi:hypothetical protein